MFRRFLIVTLLLSSCASISEEPTSSSPSFPSSPVTIQSTTPEPEDACQAKSVTFAKPPVELDKIEYMTPLGLMIDNHVTPADHIYFQNFLQPELEITAFSPATGRVADIQHFGLVDEDGEPVDDYRLVIEHSCSISTIFIHLTSLSPSLAAVAPPAGEWTPVDVKVHAGETIGSFRKNVDFNVVDLDYIEPHLLIPSHYSKEPWKVHTPDPFAYFTPSIRREMESLSLREADPVAGRFAYDIEGTLAGNWFAEGTNWYGGLSQDSYWEGHLTFAYDHIDPEAIVISIGSFEGEPRQFAVSGNAPDPAEITPDSGPVLYELADIDYFIDEERWDRLSFARGIRMKNGSQVHGTVLVEMIGPQRIRFEAFPGKEVFEVDGFTDEAVIYQR